MTLNHYTARLSNSTEIVQLTITDPVDRQGAYLLAREMADRTGVGVEYWVCDIVAPLQGFTAPPPGVSEMVQLYSTYAGPMPTDYPHSDIGPTDADYRRLNTATNLLCALLSAIEEADGDTFVSNVMYTFNRVEMKTWWAEHKEQERRRAQIRSQAIMKLTPEEIEILGLINK